jgi:hypothetical protein
MSEIPIRLRVQQALSNSLEQISIANGYKHDLTGHVFRGRDMFDDDDETPLVAILESPDEPDQQTRPRGCTSRKAKWNLFVQGWADDDKSNPTDPAHYLMADVKQRLAHEIAALHVRDALGMGNRIDELEFSPGVVRPPDAMSNKAYFWLKLSITIVEDDSEPYADT